MTTPNPWERLREAALRLVRSVGKLIHPLHDNALRRDTMHSVDAVQAALAALPATTPQPEAPALTRIEQLRSISCSLGEDHGDYDAESIERIRDAVRLLLDDALAARGGAK